MRKKVFWVAVCAICICLAGCKTSEPIVEYVERVEHEDHYTRDTIYEKEVVMTYQKADTVYRDRDRYIYKEKLVYDTTLVVQRDSIPYEVIKTEYVEKQLSTWQKILMMIGLCSIAAAVGWLFTK